MGTAVETTVAYMHADGQGGVLGNSPPPQLQASLQLPLGPLPGASPRAAPAAAPSAPGLAVPATHWWQGPVMAGFCPPPACTVGQSQPEGLSGSQAVTKADEHLLHCARRRLLIAAYASQTLLHHCPRTIARMRHASSFSAPANADRTRASCSMWPSMRPASGSSGMNGVSGCSRTRTRTFTWHHQTRCLVPRKVWGAVHSLF
jgi:hypothetical protein